MGTRKHKQGKQKDGKNKSVEGSSSNEQGNRKYLWILQTLVPIYVAGVAYAIHNYMNGTPSAEVEKKDGGAYTTNREVHPNKLLSTREHQIDTNVAAASSEEKEESAS